MGLLAQLGIDNVQSSTTSTSVKTRVDVANFSHGQAKAGLSYRLTELSATNRKASSKLRAEFD